MRNWSAYRTLAVPDHSNHQATRFLPDHRWAVNMCCIDAREDLLSSRGHDGRVTVKLLKASTATKLRAQTLTYAEVERPVGVPPVGFAYFSRTHPVAASIGFGVAGRALMTWQVQARSGLRILASSLEVELGAVVIMRLGVGALALSIPCRVVDVIDEPDRQGFSYGTLPGHPESGEESFLLHRAADGVTTFTVSAFSRPASLPARMGGPLTTAVQRIMTGRYLHALD